ncbi:YfhO family protein [Fructilactobacillus sp. Tb1]|uniref:YfhO family protein n=1 Tax=Fructilactobacillus sp. Tb1 TaxID=3422304 RepID=UPI003D26E200
MIIFFSFVFLSIFLVSPYAFGKPVVSLNDMNFHLSRAYESYFQINNGNIFHLIPDINTKTFGSFGLPINSFYPLYMMLPFVFIHLLIHSAYASYLIFLVIIYIAIFSSMYIASYKITKSKIAGIFSAVIYGCCPWITYDMFEGRDFGENLAFIVIPICLYGLYQIMVGNYKKWYILSFAMALLVLTHIVTFTLFLFFILISCGFLIINKNNEGLLRLKYLLIAGITAFGLSIFDIITLFQNYKSLGSISIHIFQLSQYTNNFSDMLTNRFGIIEPIILILSFIYWKKLNSFTKYLVLVTLAFVFISSNQFPWDVFQNYLKFLQCPWRFSTLINLLVAFIAGQLIKNFKIKTKYLLLIGTILVSVSSVLTLNMQFKHNPTANNSIYINKENFEKIESSSNVIDYIPENDGSNVTDLLFAHSIPKSNSKKQITQRNWKTSYNRIEYTINNKNKDTNINLPNIYYPGYHALVNNKEVPISVDKHHLISIPIKHGINKITLIYKKTLLTLIGILISLLTFISLITYIIKKNHFSNTNN